MDTIRLKCTGTRPLLMHNERLADPFDPVAVEMKAITSKRKKTEDDHLALMKLEFIGGLYVDDGVVVIPDLVILATFREAAKLQKLGKVVNRAIDIVQQSVPLQHAGPKNLDRLAEDPNFRDVRSVKIGQRKIMRCRPVFKKWAIEFDLLFDPEQLNKTDVLSIAKDAGSKMGFCDFRPRFGRFDVEEC